jgi:hypothetical protein
MLVLFTISNTGFMVFRHICNTSNTTTLSVIIQSNCGMEEEESADCCMTETQQKKTKEDCCDEDATFAKFLPDGKPEAETSLLSSLFSINWKLPVLTLSGWQPTLITESIRLRAHPPDPHILHPPYNSEFILSLSIMLC